MQISGKGQRMDQRVSMIMTGAQDIAKLRAFYEDGLGWKPWAAGSSGSLMYKVGHSVLVFLNGDYLAQERGEPLTQGSKTSLAVFVESKAKVDEIYQKALAAGARQTSGVRDRDDFTRAISPTPKATAGRSSGARRCRSPPTAR
jgi:uncharacterized glyoxalase superfamily protein PhnB